MIWNITGKGYNIFGKHDENACVWHFDVLEVACRQPQKYYYSNATLTCSVKKIQFALSEIKDTQ